LQIAKTYLLLQDVHSLCGFQAIAFAGFLKLGFANSLRSTFSFFVSSLIGAS